MTMGDAKYTPKSRIRDVLKSPVGHDIVAKILLQSGREMSLVENPVVGNIRLSTLRRLAPKILTDGFLQTLLDLLNAERDVPHADGPPVKEAWWKEAVVYQIYPRSFMDSNGDGIGDLNGIAQKLDYLQALGVNVLWLSPVYDSPNDDNGYDIRDYRAIMREFGTMADFDRLLAQVHARGMKLIMDLVLNHTSDEHEWFQKALADPASPCHDYYLWKKSSVPGQPPNNWTSYFSGSAWNRYEPPDEWCLHLFSKKQMDLNWENPALRAELYDMIGWWLGKGVDGFRLDVISYISKTHGLPDGNPVIGGMMGFTGVEHYFYGPRLHEYLREMRREAFGSFDIFTVGESPGTGMETSKLLTGDDRGELDTVFCFDHLENPGKTKFDDYRYDLNFLKKNWSDWQLHYGSRCWSTLFFENHDNPRMISKINPDPRFRETLGKLLAVIQFTLKGTPFVFQGQELGMVNADFPDIGAYRDVESINLYQELIKTMSPEQALRKVGAGSRDHARTPMPWSGDKHAGFTTGTPWIAVNPDYTACNARDEQAKEGSVLHFYRAMIALRRENKALVYGDFIPAHQKTTDVFCYYRVLGDARFYIEINLSDRGIRRPASSGKMKRLRSNYPDAAEKLRPYEATVYLAENE